ncbi:MAG: ribonuclease R [Pseudomonadota bacterium]
MTVLARAAKPKQESGLPTRKALLDFIQKADGVVDRREIARAFGVKGPERADLRRMLQSLEDDGTVERGAGGKRYSAQTEELPSVAVVDIMAVDDEGDLVCSPATWKAESAPPPVTLSAREAGKAKPAVGVGDRVLVRLKPDREKKGGFYAVVLKRIGKGGERVLGVFSKTRFGGVVEPVSKKIRGTFSVQRGDDAGAEDGDLVWIETKNQRGYGPKKARVREIAGSADDKGAFSLMAMANHGVPQGFTAEELAAADAAELPGPEGREDLRATLLVTIDPADARDHDDAIFAEPDRDPKNKGGWRAIVAIADVSWFVRGGDALDRGAAHRGNSTYLPDRVAPMLPERLSNDLCSLKEGVDRPCLAVEMRFSKAGQKIGHRFLRGVMRSAAGLSYEEAQAARNGEPSKRAKPLLPTVIAPLFDLYEALASARDKRQPLDLDLPERKLILNADKEVERIVRRERLDAHRLVEELMIQANVAAAETLEERRMRLIYRVHDQPDPEKLDAVGQYLETLGYQLAKGQVVRPETFNRILAKARAKGEADIIAEALLRAQRQAIYDTENLGHFGLNLRRYAHFTSPIRRYADLTVHRALVSACKLGLGGQTDEEKKALQSTAEAISNYERRSMAAEREATDRYLAAYLEPRTGAEFSGRITGVTRAGVFVRLDETGADGFCPAKALGFEYFRFDEERVAMVGDASGLGYRLGQTVKVRLEEATPITGGLRVSMLSDPEPVPDARRPKEKRGKAPQRRSRSEADAKPKRGPRKGRRR